MSAKENKILILGAGPAGLTAAYKLSQAGYSVTVLERDGGAGCLRYLAYFCWNVISRHFLSDTVIILP
ncbi:MAG: FAD-dependent oxidoreductase, partial [Gloeomargarita sp. GMQP_bins_5]